MTLFRSARAGASPSTAIPQTLAHATASTVAQRRRDFDAFSMFLTAA
jgi:hypothetical protein